MCPHLPEGHFLPLFEAANCMRQKQERLEFCPIIIGNHHALDTTGHEPDEQVWANYCHSKLSTREKKQLNLVFNDA